MRMRLHGRDSLPVYRDFYERMAEKYGKDKVIATVLADRMERYFSTGLLG